MPGFNETEGIVNLVRQVLRQLADFLVNFFGATFFTALLAASYRAVAILSRLTTDIMRT